MASEFEAHRKAPTRADRPLPTSVRWLAVGLNVALLCTEGLLLARSSVTADEVVMVSMLVATPIFNLALFLDYHRRGLLASR